MTEGSVAFLQVTLFTRGKSPVTQQIPGESNMEYAEYSSRVRHLKGDRKDFDGVRSLLKGSGFQVVYDINGRFIIVHVVLRIAHT